MPRYVWNKGKRTCPKVPCIRLADDCIMTGATQALLHEEVQPLVEAFLQARGLQLSPAQTVSTPMADGLDLLGQPIRTDHGQRRIKPSAKRSKTRLRTVRGVIKANKRAAAGSLIGPLHPLMRGWAMSHRHAVSAHVCQAVDHAIFQALWRWAQRRHPHKGGRWVKARSFPPIDHRHWVLAGQARGPQGPRHTVHLLTAHRLPSPRHTKLHSEANPYDPQGERSLAKRLGLTMATSCQGRKTVRHRWRCQQGRCAHGGDAIPTLTGWHSHPKVWRSHGGRDTVDQQVLLPPTCHRQVHHSLGSTRMPPPVTRGFGKA